MRSMNNPLQSPRLARVTRAFLPDSSRDAQNIWYLNVEVFWWGMLFSVANAFLAVFTIRAGGTDTHVGLLSALPALVSTLFSIPASRLVERERKPLRVLQISAFLNRLGYFAVGLVPLFIGQGPANFIVAFVGLLSIANAVSIVAFTTMFGRAVRAEERPHVISTRNVLVGISGIVVAFFGGKFLELVEFPYNYSILFSVAFAASLLSNYYLGRIRLPAVEPPPETSAITQPRGARQVITMLRANQRYVYFALSQFVFHWGVFFAVPLYSIFWVRNLGAGESWVGISRMVESATSIIAFPLWARFVARRGNRRALFISSIGMTCYTIMTPFLPSPEWIAVLSILGGAGSSGFSLALFNELLHVSPEQNRPIFAAVFNTTINFAAFVSPLVSTSLIPFFGIHAMLFAAAGFRLLGVFSIWRNISRQATG